MYLSAAPAIKGASAETRLTPDPALSGLIAQAATSNQLSTSAGTSSYGVTEPSPLLLLEAAILFSDPGEARAAATRQAVTLAIAEAARLAETHDTAYKLGEAILALTHERFFSRYVESESGLDAAVLEGRYNCVSSSALYLILARAAGLNASGVITKDHSFCKIGRASCRERV